MTSRLPQISIITPSFNQAKFIQKTIDSILSQGYPNLEYIIMDGGSTDGTVDILKRYKNKFRWYSQRDKGQSDALNKGMKMVSGDIVGYVNSDDYLEPGALSTVGKFFSDNPKAFWVTGKCKIVDSEGREVRQLITAYKNFFLKYLRKKQVNYVIQFISQPATFWRKSVNQKIGYFDESLIYDMDYDYWLRFWQNNKLDYIDEYLASYRVHKSSKAIQSPEMQFEIEFEIVKRYTDSKIILYLHKLHVMLVLSTLKFFHSK